MRTVTGLFEQLCDPYHLDRAIDSTVRGKRHRGDVAWFLFRREDELARLRIELAAGRYRPGAYEMLAIRDPKPRLIARLPIADRVVQTALVHAMEPAFERSYSPDDFACRPGFGTHRALLRLRELMGRHRFAVHLDVKSYFPSIDREILKALLRRRIRDRPFLAIVDRVLDSACDLYADGEHRRLARLDPDWPPPDRGLPVGSYTSQLFAAHVYLLDFDHWIKRTVKVPGYLRYVDDLFLFGDQRATMRRYRAEVGAWLAEHRHLRLKHPEARILSCRGHLDALGHRIRRDGVDPLPRTLKRFQRTIARALDPPRRGDRRPDLERSIAASRDLLLP